MSSPAALEIYCFREALSSLGPLCLTEARALTLRTNNQQGLRNDVQMQRFQSLEQIWRHLIRAEKNRAKLEVGRNRRGPNGTSQKQSAWNRAENTANRLTK